MQYTILQRVIRFHCTCIVIIDDLANMSNTPDN